MRRPQRARIYEARRAGLRARMVGSWHLAADVADRILEAWDAEAASRGMSREDGAYWGLEAEAWMAHKAGLSDDR